MRTLTLHVSDEVAEVIKQLVALLPDETASVEHEYEGPEYVSDEEQAEIEELLKDPDCNIPGESKTFERGPGGSWVEVPGAADLDQNDLG